MKKTIIPFLFALSVGSCGDNAENEKTPADSTLVGKDKIDTPVIDSAIRDTNTTVNAQPITATVRLNTMFCQKATDENPQPSDEVYLLVTGVKSDNTKYNKVLPQADYPYTQWDFDDAGQNGQYLDPRYTRPNNTPINRPKPFTGQLNNGDSISIAMIFMEDDGGDDAQRAASLATQAQAVAGDNAYVQVVATATRIVAKLSQVFNQDDVIGVLYITLKNDNGRLVHTWSLGQNAVDAGQGEHGWGRNFNLIASGHEYRTYWTVREGNPEADN